MKKRKYYKLGFEAGKNAGSWTYDGNTDISWFRSVLKGYEDGDPVIMDMQPSPLSGEWAGESIRELFGKIPTDAQLDEYETGFSNGFWETVIEACQSAVDWETVQREQESNYLRGLGV